MGAALDALISQLADAARRTTGARNITITMADDEAGRIHVRWSSDGLPSQGELGAMLERHGVAQGGFDLPIETPSLTAGAQEWSAPRNYARLADLPGTALPPQIRSESDRIFAVRAVRVHPLRAEDRHLGLMIFVMDRPLEPRDEAVMDAFGAQGALLLQNALLARTLERRVEERTCEHRQALEALHDQTRALERANQELRELDLAKSNFLATVSHELRTPLVSIQGYNELMLREALGPITAEQRRGLNVAVRNLGLLVDLIDNLLYFAQRQSGLHETPTTSVDLVSVMEDAVELVTARAAERGVKIAVQRLGQRVTVRANRYEIHRLVVNLLSNAIKFNRERDGSVQVLTRPAEAFAELVVADTGIGIAETEQQRIFERFYQVDGSRTRRFGGAGIGLAVALDIARAHGGGISVRSAPGEGSEFTVRLPRVT